MKMKHTLLAILLLLTTVTLHGQRRRGNGTIVTDTRPIENFTQLKVSGAFDVQITTENSAVIKITTDENLLPYIVTKVNAAGELSIRRKKGVILKPSKGRSISIEIPHRALSKIALSGSGSISSGKDIETSATNIHLSGSGSIDLLLLNTSTEVNNSGSGSVRLSGSTQKLEATQSGSGAVILDQLVAEDAHVHLAGSGEIRLWAAKVLDAAVSGSGRIRYKDTPTAKIKSKIVGSGSIRKF